MTARRAATIALGVLAVLLALAVLGFALIFFAYATLDLQPDEGGICLGGQPVWGVIVLVPAVAALVSAVVTLACAYRARRVMPPALVTLALLTAGVVLFMVAPDVITSNTGQC